MKLKYELMVREIAGDYVLVPLGSSALQLSGMLATNEVGAFLCEALQEERTGEELVEAVLAEFEVDRPTAAADVQEFLAQMERLGLLE